MIYILINNFTKSTATANRFLAECRGLKELGVNFKIVLTSAGDLYPNIDESIYGEVICLWPKLHFNNNTINKFVRKFYNEVYCPQAFKRFLKRITKFDSVILINDMANLHAVLALKHKIGCKVYHERTEHPNAYKVFPTDALEKQYLKDCSELDGLFVIQSKLKKAFESFGVNESKIHVINMIVDSKRFEGIKKNNSSERYIAYCGTIHNTKDGVDDLIKAFKKVVEKVPDAKLYIIGPTPSNKDFCVNMSLIYELGLNDTVVLTGKVDAKDMPQLLKNAEVLVLARPNNLQAEHGFPTKLGEYLLTKNPVVITRTGTIDEFLVDGESALLCNPEDIDDIAEKITWSLNNPKESEGIGENGAKIALKEFNYKVESSKILDVISK